MRKLLDEAQLREGVSRLADELRHHYGDRPITIVAVLTGSVVFLADLIRRLEMPIRIGLVQARSYRGQATSPGALVINTDMLPDIREQDVLVVDDIFDTGRTLLELLHEIDAMGPSSLRSAVLLRKRGRKEVEIDPDHVGFEIPNQFVVGYGLDFNDLYRNLPYLAAMQPGDLEAGSPQGPVP